MAYIEGVSDELITFFITLFTVITLVFSWLSTNVREFPFPANLLVIERHSRRLYTTTYNGNINRIITSQRLGTSSTTTTTTTVSNSPDNIQNDLINSSTPSENNNATLDTRNEIVDEIVEQALVENLLEGTIYTASDITEATQQNPITQTGVNTIVTEERNVAASNSVQDTFPGAPEVANEEVLRPENSLTEESSPMNILIRFVNEKEMKIQAKPDDTILLIKRTHFESELSNNKIVRFIYQGQFLCDKNTIKSYNIKDKTTIHCHITSKQQQQTLRSDQTATDTTNNIRQRIQNHQISTISRITGGQNNLPQQNTTISDQSTDPAETPESEVAVDNSENTPVMDNGVVTSIISSNSTNNTNPENNNVLTNLNEQSNATNNTTIISIELSNFLLPLFAMLISCLWYFRINFKHFFSPLSTLILFVFTFVYAIFIINNIHSTTTMAAANFIFHNRIWRNRGVQNNVQTTSTTTVTNNGELD